MCFFNELYWNGIKAKCLKLKNSVGPLVLFCLHVNRLSVSLFWGDELMFNVHNLNHTIAIFPDLFLTKLKLFEDHGLASWRWFNDVYLSLDKNQSRMGYIYLFC